MNSKNNVGVTAGNKIFSGISIFVELNDDVLRHREFMSRVCCAREGKALSPGCCPLDPGLLSKTHSSYLTHFQ